MSFEIADVLISFGLTDLHRYRGLKNVYHRCYIAIIDEGNVVYEKLGDNDVPEMTYKGDDFVVSSSKYTGKSAAHIQINNGVYEFAPDKVGLNILVVDKLTKTPLDAVVIDFSDDAEKFTRPFKMDELTAYEEFRREYKPIKLPKLELDVGAYPYGETAVIFDRKGNEKRESLQRLADENRLNTFNVGEATVLSSVNLEKDTKDVQYIFTGIARWKKKVILGQKDIINNELNVGEIREAIGCFALLTFDGECIELSSDYFGAYSWYYYSDHGLTVASTSYHFLLLTLRACNVQLQLNTDRVLAEMSFFGGAFESGLTSKMSVDNCIELPPDKRILVKNYEMRLENTSLYSERHNSERYTEQLYEKYLLKAKEEMIENCKAVFEHPSIDYVRCDLSGGADTRLVLGAIMNLPKKSLQKLRIVSSEREELAKDFEIASSIVTSLDLKWDDIPYTSSVKEPREGHINPNIASQDLGVQSEFVYGAITDIRPRTFHLCGAYGEVVTKKSGTFHGAKTDCGLESVLSELCKPADVVPLGSAGTIAKRFIADELLKAETSDIDVMLDYYSLESYTRHHFRLKRNLLWTPLMSKSAYKLKRMYTTVHKDLKLRFDVAAALNPLLSCFEYDNQTVNEEKIKLNKRLYSIYNVKATPLSNNSDKTEFVEAQKRKIITHHPSKAAVRERVNAVNSLLSSTELHLSALKVFLDYSDKFNEIGFPLFRFFRTEKGVPAYFSGFRFAINRITRLLQIYWQIQIIDGD